MDATSQNSLPQRSAALVVMGIAGSGKTSVAQALAAHYGLAFLDADDVHSAEAKAQMARGVPLTDAQRVPWVAALALRLRQSIDAGRSVVLAFSGLRRAHRQQLRDSGVPMRFVFLHGAAHVIAERLARRSGHFMPPALLQSQIDTLELPLEEPDVLSVAVDAPFDAMVADAIAQLDATPGGARVGAV
ncbi:gluconokinase [Xanthomonas translucens pv. undulosa]|uniref:gluconokinase n=1 Tax=Xanthomonas campestris pv. translucens TaxID=343 RepID=UPI0019D6D8FE|nr:gluconokinase [Xanthomonas translucens]QSQ52383.1 gluconokinase [Xanthomonas translucens pv. undulosa]QSQ58698.1 gluconokinase [Xanthomonas translucens pv. undulosa]